MFSQIACNLKERPGDMVVRLEERPRKWSDKAALDETRTKVAPGFQTANLGSRSRPEWTI